MPPPLGDCCQYSVAGDACNVIRRYFSEIFPPRCSLRIAAAPVSGGGRGPGRGVGEVWARCGRGVGEVPTHPAPVSPYGQEVQQTLGSCTFAQIARAQ